MLSFDLSQAHVAWIVDLVLEAIALLMSVHTQVDLQVRLALRRLHLVNPSIQSPQLRSAIFTAACHFF